MEDRESPSQTPETLPDKTAQELSQQDLDDALEETFPASDPIPTMGAVTPKEGGADT
jgi:hypothetical protein